MYKIMVHIKNDDKFMDENVCVEINLPAVPRVGEFVYLKRELFDVLENKAKSTLDIGGSYFPDWFSGDSRKLEYYEDLKPENLKDIDFSDAISVNSIAFFADSDTIHIELYSNL